jgi:hypothetical protein
MSEQVIKGKRIRMNRYEIQRGFLIVFAVIIISGILIAPGVIFQEKFAFYITSCTDNETCWLENSAVAGVVTMGIGWAGIIAFYPKHRIRKEKPVQIPKKVIIRKPSKAKIQTPKKTMTKHTEGFSFNRTKE